MTPAPARLRPGTTLRTGTGATVTVRSWRGEGSYARVYQASLAGAACALKLPKTEVEGAVERVAGERDVLSRLRHPQVVRLLDSGTHEGTPFLLLEWLDGETLHDLVQSRRRLPLRHALESLERVLEGLEAVHGLGLVHGDIRPQNIICVPGRGAVLTDPGAGPGFTREDDLRAAGDLLHLMLTGEAPAGPPRLSTAVGYSRGAVQLWELTRSASPPSAGELLAQARRLRASL